MILYQKFEYNKDEWAKFVASAIFAATQHRLGTLAFSCRSRYMQAHLLFSFFPPCPHVRIAFAIRRKI